MYYNNNIIIARYFEGIWDIHATLHDLGIPTMYRLWLSLAYINN